MLLEQDLRYRQLSDVGKSELKIYLDRIESNSLQHTEEVFVEFFIGRVGAASGRHLFCAWKVLYKLENMSEIDTLQVMRFFLNPSNTAFENVESSGWFELIIPLSGVVDDTKIENTVSPVFEKIGFLRQYQGETFLEIDG